MHNKMGYRTTSILARPHWLNRGVILLISVVLGSSPANADGNKYYGALVGSFEDRFHGIKGEVISYVYTISRTKSWWN